MFRRPLSLLVPVGLAIAVLPAALPAAAEDEPPPPPCAAPEFSQFDFWVGEWDVSWTGGQGTNTITREYEDCVIRERFETDGLRGTSLSAWSPRRGVWQQTWVDNNGSYLEFEGGMVGDRMILAREAPGDSGTTLQRMVFFDIEPDSFTWNWEKSTDEGDSWELLWQIAYQRRP